mgnify:CR=1 FL=1
MFFVCFTLLSASSQTDFRELSCCKGSKNFYITNICKYLCLFSTVDCAFFVYMHCFICLSMWLQVYKIEVKWQILDVFILVVKKKMYLREEC